MNNKQIFTIIACFFLANPVFTQNISPDDLRRAKNGDDEYMHLVASSYEDANMIDSAIYWYTKAAQKGNLYAQTSLGQIYDKREDYKNAFIWYQKAAIQGYGWAQFKIGHYYHYGLGVEADDKLAAKWLKSAAEIGFSYGLPQYEYGKYYAEKEESKYWLLKSAEAGYEEALTTIGEGYQTGMIGVNVDSAYHYFLSASIKGSADAMWYLSECYALGEGCEQSYWRALGLYYQAAQKNSSRLNLDKSLHAHNNSVYLYNPKTQQKELKPNASYYWYKDMVYNDNISSGYKIMECYMKGEYGVSVNTDEASTWCEALANAGLLEAQILLARTFEKVNDLDKAKYWYEKGANSTEYMKDNTTYEEYLNLKKECQEALERLRK